MEIELRSAQSRIQPNIKFSRQR